MYKFNAIAINDSLQTVLLKKFREIFIDEQYPQKILMSNHLKNIETVLDINKIQNIKFPNMNDVYLYHERMGIVYQTNYQYIRQYIEQLEVWEDVDLLIFDESYKWYIAITHNDNILTSGVIQ